MHVLDFPLWLRILHFCNLLFVTLLIRSGLEILSAHPKLYWNDNCLPGTAWLHFGDGVPSNRRLAPTPQFGTAAAPAEPRPPGKIAALIGLLIYVLFMMFLIPRRPESPDLIWTSRDEEISLPSWLGLPGRKNLGLARHWHFLCDGGWLITGVVYYTLLFATGEWRRMLPESWSVFPNALHQFVQYATFHLVEIAGYNALQKIAYSVIVFVVAPITIATGIAMSPSITARFPWYLKIFRGRQPARSIHFLCMCAFAVFLVIHVAMVIAHGFGRELALIVLGETRHPNTELALLVGCSGLAGVFAIHVLATVVSLKRPRFVQNSIGVLIDGGRRVLFGHTVSRQQYPMSEVASYFRVNGRPPANGAYAALAESGFRAYEFEVGGLVARPLRLSLDELKRLPKSSQITKHCCIQGWSAVGQWGGVELKHILDLAQPLPEARYIAFYAFDNKSETEPNPDAPGYFYGTIHIDLARDPQTILAYEMNGEPLPIPHGAPLRLRVETQLGFMMVKYIQRIELMADYRELGEGQGGWREDYQYYSPEAGI